MTSPEQITVSLEWAKKLKEAGWPQDDSSHFLWFRDKNSNHRLRPLSWLTPNRKALIAAAAPTAEEILRRLPWMIDNCVLSSSKDDEGTWICYYETMDQNFLYSFEDKRLANAAAAMYVYLVSQNLL